MTTADDISLYGKANGYLEYSSTTVNIYLNPLDGHMGPTKSMESLSHGFEAWTNVSVVGLKNWGFSYSMYCNSEWFYELLQQNMEDYEFCNSEVVVLRQDGKDDGEFHLMFEFPL